ncbi:bifunctional phosphopantothenoylcysteine decarboxylase/phosphopantothenate--cysteine ligase CoaBC [Sphingomonas sp. KRR8]|uniref:bifunctional phosphopantothenoylcysteine decarboxylase/phosphopantothenate--cysteine ligase CoaBC n=1 Tax=Sphingomonas sp. KRR8 TaxID=2942996 RepID=UPI0020216D6A|nr:bifunctional phosphopantothenoylcysteine decarboxylase/phosphopantothenate--cysteine ligase CoaBC [Sphingomonas sp. KRR8]URD61426.1 bifunctional phosphopantothenoylcysteine decarboxylase/phosphopantothenate--cysteine ligase CoaBC [Sphingomonas sp. KRR8]
MANILLIVGGGIAAFKAAELIRLARRQGHGVTPVLTDGGSHFITPMTLAALAESPVYTSLWDLKDETEMGHIQLSRAADLILVCPATADLLARMAAGIADDLATTLLLATDKSVFVAPAMNVRMWQHEATRANVATLRARSVTVIEPTEGEMACGEYGPGRLPEPTDILAQLNLAPSSSLVPGEHMGGVDHIPSASASLRGKHILVTAGPTHEAIDPVRVIANRSSGRQGFAIAAAAAQAGARVTLVSGPVHLPTPGGVARIEVETADQMQAAVQAALPCDAAILVAAVADWKVAASATKLKKGDGAPEIRLLPNPDILRSLAKHPDRPRLLVGFAAETDDLLANAAAKREAKGADWIVANDVSGDVMGGTHNHVHLVTASGTEDWAEAPKSAVAARLIARIAEVLSKT